MIELPRHPCHPPRNVPAGSGAVYQCDECGQFWKYWYDAGDYLNIPIWRRLRWRTRQWRRSLPRVAR
jgi:hypothetical protein